MTVFKYFLKGVYDKKATILLYISIFMIVVLMNRPSNLENNTPSIGVVNRDNSQISKELIAFLKEDNDLVEMEDDYELIHDRIFLRYVDSVIIIPKNLGEKLDNIELISHNNQFVEYYLEGQINKFMNYTKAVGNKDGFNFEKSNLILKEKSNLVLVDQNKYDEEMNRHNIGFSLNFTSYIIISIIMTIITLTMSEFQEEEVLNRVYISSKKLTNYEFQIYLAQMVVTFLIVTILLGLVFLMYREYLSGVNLLLNILNTYIFSISILSFTYFIYSSITNKMIKNNISTLASLGISFISGAMISQEYLSNKLLKVASFFPTYHYIRANDMLAVGNNRILPQMGIQILFSILFVILGLYFQKIKRKS